MKTYEIRKIVKAKSLKEAMKKEKTIDVEYIIMTDDDDEDTDDEDWDGKTIMGFKRK